MLKLSLPITRQACTLPLIIFILAIMTFFLPDNISDLLIYNRHSINDGEFWRLLTGHFDHTNFNHLLLNIAGLSMLWALHGEHYSSKSYAVNFLFAAIFCSLGIYFFVPDMIRYVGLSGVLHGIFVWGAICDIQKGWKSGYLLLLAVWGKILYEQVFGASADVEAMINARVAIDAHLWGAIGGLIYPAWGFINKQLNRK
ncbi:rhombosortase [Thalassotalea sp. 42_200_T64]|nr:rhombosortase [Thalassotalea sp. 42_200_T64]